MMNEEQYKAMKAREAAFQWTELGADLERRAQRTGFGTGTLQHYAQMAFDLCADGQVTIEQLVALLKRSAYEISGDEDLERLLGRIIVVCAAIAETYGESIMQYGVNWLRELLTKPRQLSLFEEVKDETGDDVLPVREADTHSA